MSVDSSLSHSTARATIRSLLRGTVLQEGAVHLNVGHQEWLAAQLELLAEVADDGYSDTKFIRGAYGSGKSHFLSVLQTFSRQGGWATAHLECKSDGVQIDRFETIFPKITEKLVLPNGRPGVPDDQMRGLLGLFADGLAAKVGLRSGGLSRPFDTDERLYSILQSELVQSDLPVPFVKAIAAYVRAHHADDLDSTSAVLSWLRGGQDRVHISRAYLDRPSGVQRPSVDTFELRPLAKGTAPEALKGLLWLLRKTGCTGLVLCIDEVEELAKLRTRTRRDQALQALREHVDNAGGDGGYRHMCLYLAATPEMFESPDYFPRYDALASRIHPIGSAVNWRSPVIDLDRTPLSDEEMIRIAFRICEIHTLAYGAAAFRQLGEDAVRDLTTEVVGSTIGFAKPRLLVRLVVHELERARQEGAAYKPLTEVDDRLVTLSHLPGRGD